VSSIPLSSRVQAIKPSPTLAVTNRASALRAAGKDVVDLGAGEPDFDTPLHIKQAAIVAIQQGDTKYTAVDGTAALKSAIVGKFKRENSLDYAPDQILVSTGAKHSLFNLFLALLEKGDEVLIPAPYWVSYPDMALLAEAVPRFVTAPLAQAFKITAEQLEGAITPKTRLFVLNSPSNPTGAVYNRDELHALAQVLLRHPNVFIVTDDIYEHILWTGEPFQNIVNVCPELGDRTVVVNGVSKAYAMTGWRIGYAAGPKALIGAMRKIQSQSTSNPTSIAQAAAVAALNGDQQCIVPMVTEFKRRHDRVVEGLNALPGVAAAASAGTFYSFPDFSQAIASMDGIADDLALAEYFLEPGGVALVPGSAFGLAGHLRLSYATDMNNLERALERMAVALQGR